MSNVTGLTGKNLQAVMGTQSYSPRRPISISEFHTVREGNTRGKERYLSVSKENAAFCLVAHRKAYLRQAVRLTETLFAQHCIPQSQIRRYNFGREMSAGIPSSFISFLLDCAAK